MSDYLKELGQAARGLAKRPLFTLVAIASIAVGIGANATIFSVFNSLLLRGPAGVPDAARVVELGRTMGGGGFDSFSWREVERMRELGGPLERAAGVRTVSLSMNSGGEGERVHAYAVTHEYFDVLGVRPARGRSLSPSDDAVPGAEAVVVVSHAFWQNRLGGSDDVVGSTISLNRHPFTVVGVMPVDFHGHIALVRPDAYIPMTMMTVADPGFNLFDTPNATWLQAVGRLAPGATVEQVDEALDGMVAGLRAEMPEFYERRGAAAMMLSSVPAAGRGLIAGFLSALLGLVGMILLVTCANVAGMLIARAAGREREIAIRLALGAGRSRLIRQLLSESLLLFAVGGAVGLLLATWAAGALGGIRIPAPIPIYFDFSVDTRVVLFGGVVALLTGVMFGLAPAVQSTRPSLVTALKNESGRPGSAGGRMRRMFVGGQVALTVALLLSAGLFLRALQRAAMVDTGFSADGVALVSFDLAIDGYDEERGAAFMAAVLERAAAVPGISAVGRTSDLPLDLSINESSFYPEGMTVDDDTRGIGTAFAFADGGFFDALEVEVRRGRVFDVRDTPGSEPVVVVSRELAERTWPGEDPIGKRIGWGSPGELRTVVGVVADVKNQTLMEELQPMVYLPIDQLYRSEMTLVARSDAGAAVAGDALRGALRELDPRLSLTPVQSLAEYNALGVLPQRVAAAATVSFGLLALLLSAIGVYGVVAFMVAQRTREIGVRMALGADRRSVVALIVRNGMRLALPGAVLGALAGLGLGYVLRSFILDVAPADPVALIGAPLVLLVAVLAACWVPAARAAAVEPMTALRSE